ncbi:MAG: hypothetical protein IJJ33_12470 [Victivallales bacterium]|nr:hypothetical protein [Victivallales bacterium]
MKRRLPLFLLLPWLALAGSLEWECAPDGQTPEWLVVHGVLQQGQDGPFLANREHYVTAVIAFTGEGGASGALELELCGLGLPLPQLGVILYEKTGDGLERVCTSAWLKGIPADAWSRMKFDFPSGTFREGRAYRLYLYRANESGDFRLKAVRFQTRQAGHDISLHYENTPDLVGPLSRGPSGKPDFHIHLSGLEPKKSIREIVVSRPGGRWVSGDDVKKNYWMIDYYDAADFPMRRNPRNNFDGALHQGLRCIDLVMEGGYAEGASYLCEVFYSDGTKEEFHAELPRPPRPPVPMVFAHSVPLLGRSPAAWESAAAMPSDKGRRPFFPLFSEKERLAEGLLMRGRTHRRLWSLGWFLPYSGMNPNPSPSQVKSHCPLVYRAALREMQVVDADGRDLTREARLLDEGVSSWQAPRLAIDGDVSLDSAAVTAPPSLAKPKRASLALVFPCQRRLGKVTLHHGCRNGCLAAWIASDFSLEYLRDGAWLPVPGASVQGNQAEYTEHSLDSLVAEGIRLTITAQSPLVDYALADWSPANSLLDLRKADSVPPDVTFHWWYLGHDSVLHYGLPADGFQPSGESSYREWRAKHPNFLGFQLVEFDNDLDNTLGWGSYRDQKGAKACYERASRRLVVHRSIPSIPKTRAEAVRQYQAVFELYHRMMFQDSGNFSSVTIWHHQPLAWGAVSTAMECFGGCPVFSMQVAAARGAARQFGDKPWGCYFATYLGHAYLNYLKSDGKTFGPTCGKSASLYRRQLYYAYLTGAAFCDYEHADIAFVTQKATPGEQPVLSPHGQAVLEASEFARRDAERGQPYAPIAMLLDWEHGWDSHEGRKIWKGMFTPTLADRNIDAWMKGVFGNSELPQEGHGCNMSQTGFSGLADILVLNPPCGAVRNLDDYPAAILLGEHRWSPRTVEAIREYVRKGGMLLVNVEQLPPQFDSQFTGVELDDGYGRETSCVNDLDGQPLGGPTPPFLFRHARLLGARALLRTPAGEPLATVSPHGQGKVLLTLQKFLVEEPEHAGPKQGLNAIHFLLSLLRHELLPFQVTGDSPVELVVSRLARGWRLSILNNRGVYKQATTAPLVVPSEATRQTIFLPGQHRYTVLERISDKALQAIPSHGGESVSVVIPPGELVILDLLRGE